MPAKAPRVPSYRLHKPSGQAVVTLSGKDVYLGPHGSAVSRREYDRVVGEWIARGRVPLPPAGTELLVKELIARYWRHAQNYYTKGGRPTSQQTLVHYTIRDLRRMYGETPAAEFSPNKLKALRQTWIDRKLARSTCNAHTARVKRVFRWGTAEELAPAIVAYALREVPGLAKGRSAAEDRPPIGPAPQAAVDAVLPIVRPQIATMIKLQLLCGARPGEIVLLRAADIDRSGAVWRFVPEQHKVEHKGRSRTVFLGPAAQVLLEPWLTRFPEGWLFRPNPRSVKPGRKQRKPEWPPRYSVALYAALVSAACDRAKVEHWTPNQLRHACASRVRAAYGLEAAQVVLGHSRADVTQVYAERDLEKARAAMMEIG